MTLRQPSHTRYHDGHVPGGYAPAHAGTHFDSGLWAYLVSTDASLGGQAARPTWRPYPGAGPGQWNRGREAGRKAGVDAAYSWVWCPNLGVSGPPPVSYQGHSVDVSYVPPGPGGKPNAIGPGAWHGTVGVPLLMPADMVETISFDDGGSYWVNEAQVLAAQAQFAGYQIRAPYSHMP